MHDPNRVRIVHGDCVDGMRGLADASVDLVIADPPYDIGVRQRPTTSADA